MQSYKVIREYINRSYGIQKAGDIVKFGPASPFAPSLLENGFIEPIINYPAASCGVLDPVRINYSLEREKNGIISHLANVLIAPEDYAEGAKRYFTWDEACAIEKKLGNGWRLPTRSEWVLICEEFGQKDGVMDVETLMKNLSLAKNGVHFSDGDILSAGDRGFYWSSTPGSDGVRAYGLDFYGTRSIYPSSYYGRQRGFSVRLVKDL